LPKKRTKPSTTRMGGMAKGTLVTARISPRDRNRPVPNSHAPGSPRAKASRVLKAACRTVKAATAMIHPRSGKAVSAAPPDAGKAVKSAEA
jgi:hypothetical protein